MASLRSQILRNALPHIPTQSFTRQTLLTSLSSLPSSSTSSSSNNVDHEFIIDTIFGPDLTLSGKALVEAWDEEGVSRMMKIDDVEERLAERLVYSSEVGEHLVEAYALLTTPSTTHSLPIPNALKALTTFLPQQIPPLYNPPSSSFSSPSSSQPAFSSSSSSSPHSSDDPPTPASTLSYLQSRSNNRLPLLTLNPIGPLSYAWCIADSALSPAEKQTAIKKGIMGEPTGSGPEWYSSRLGLSLAYLSAESHLLQPYPAHPKYNHRPDQAQNPHLPTAMAALRKSLRRLDYVRDKVEGVERGVGGVFDYADFLGRGLLGVIRSRG